MTALDKTSDAKVWIQMPYALYLSNRWAYPHTEQNRWLAQLDCNIQLAALKEMKY